MLMPKRVKRRRVHRGNLRGRAARGNKVNYGEYGLMAMEPTWITANQIEAARIAINRKIKRGGKVWIKIFPHKPITRKPAETRMGAGKGSPEYWVAIVKPGRIMFELAGVNEELAREALRLAAMKLPIKCKFVKREGDFVVEYDAKKSRQMKQQQAQALAAAGLAEQAVEATGENEDAINEGGASDES